MGKLLFIGVTCVDVVIGVDALPRTAEDVVATEHKVSLGGCAFNAFSTARALGEPSVLFSPVGSGMFGDLVRNGLRDEGIPVLVENGQMANGCCYCLVEPGGERTFISHHGAEYHYEAEWFEAIDLDEVDAVYVCGLEVEAPTGSVVVDFLERGCRGKRIFFTPGPRPGAIPSGLLDRLLGLNPLLHMNGDEAFALAGRMGGLCRGAGAFGWGDAREPPSDGGVEGLTRATEDIVEAASMLRERVGNMVFVTLGSDGCYFDDGTRRGVIPGTPARVVDTIGAGDSHIGALMARLHRGDSVEDAVACANRVAAAVVSTAGAHAAADVIRRAARGPVAEVSAALRTASATRAR